MESTFTWRWKEDEAYDYFDDIDAEACAWEGLRRNGDYQRTFHRLEGLSAEEAAGRVKPWGLRFCR